jgi:uncharacterized protein (TIGR00290 family)
MWSGGKDSALALDRARRAGLNVELLLSFHDPATQRVRFHATRVEMLRAQGDAVGALLRPIGCAWQEMDSRLRAELAELKRSGFAGVVFGDIHLADVRAWYEERVRAAGLEHVEPIWGEHPQALLREFVDRGGRAVVSCVQLSKLDQSWLGRIVDANFVSDISELSVDACGENGEYHTFTFAGPAFARQLDWRAGETRQEGDFVQLDVLPSYATTPMSGSRGSGANVGGGRSVMI